MNDLKTSFVQLWQTIPTARKVSLVASAVVVIAVLVGMIYFSSKPKLTLLYSGLSSGEAAKIVEYLDSKKIKYELNDGGATILVPSTQVYSTRLALAGQGIPRTSDTAGGVGFELFDKPSFGMSDFMQKANYYRALQGELARTIKQMEEINEARVMIVVPEERLFSREKRESKASVFVQLKSGRILSPTQVYAIRFLVANGVEGLQPNRVAVVDSSGRALAEDDEVNSLNLTVHQRSLVKATEDQLRDKAQSMLDAVLGPGQAVVRITADINFDAISQTSEKFDPKSAVVRTETIANENNSSTTQGNNTTVGVTSNTQNPSSAGGNASSTKQEKENTTNQYEINRTVETRQQAVGDIRRLSLAVFVNMRPAAAAGAQPQVRTAQEMKALEDIVKEAVGFNATRQDSIKVQETQFADLFGQPAPVSTSATVVKEMDRWLPYASQAFLVVLAIAIFLYFRSIIRDANDTTSEVESEFTALLDRIEREQKPTTKEEGGASPKSPGYLGADEMTKLVREHPASTAQAIKEWLSEN
jgi:flagellar M-ring protein FliF